MNIVLVHGILGFRKKFGVEYFRDVAKHFTGKGMRVYAADLDPTKGVPHRGAELRDQIGGEFASGRFDAAQPTHIIAHSMGGLDSRWMLSPANPRRIQHAIRSLTTISTPHHGSAIADFATGPERLAAKFKLPLGGGIPLLETALNAVGLSLAGQRDLTSAACEKFNAAFPNDPNVSYHSVAGRGREGESKTAKLFYPFWEYLSSQSGEPNDGMVTVSSATWGELDKDLWPADHAEEIGTDLDTLGPTKFPWLEKYDQIVARVEKL